MEGLSISNSPFLSVIFPETIVLSKALNRETVAYSIGFSKLSLAIPDIWEEKTNGINKKKKKCFKFHSYQKYKTKLITI